MKKWQRRTVGILTLGGSGAGLVIVLGQIFGTSVATIGFAILMVALILFAIGIAAGVLVLENHKLARTLALPFWAIQIPAISTPWVTYEFSSGARFNFLLAQGGNINFTWAAGSQFSFYIGQHSAVALGVNILAIAVFWVLFDDVDLLPDDAPHVADDL